MREMVGNQMRRFIEPEIRDLTEHFTLAGNRVGQYHVEGRQAVTGDHQQALIIKAIDIADFAPVQQGQAGQMGSVQGRRHCQYPNFRNCRYCKAEGHIGAVTISA